MKINKAIENGYSFLQKYNIQSARLDSEILMSLAIKKEREYIILNSDKELKNESFSIFQDLIIKRSKGKPIAYLIGKKNFWKNEFIVSEDILIPRPDTEILIEHTLRIVKRKSSLNLLEIGVGSGCIILSILNEKKDFYGTGIDISKKCVEISKINALKLNLSNRVKFLKSDVDNFFYGKYDLIISNPPYIKKLDLKYLERDVVNFEPKLALDGGLEGLSKIKKVIDRSSSLLKKNGKLILEIAFDSKDKVKKLLKDKGFYINEIIKDYAKNDRCVISTKL